jgi:2-oxo-3-hexenedioate decarboxylase
LHALADTLLQARAAGRQIAPPTRQPASLSLSQAYRVAALCRARQVAGGERPVGRKIGFTNRLIWPEYGVWAPIWGTVYDSSLQQLDGEVAGAVELAAEAASAAATSAADAPAESTATLRAELAGLCEPRIEPEIVFGLARAPRAGMDLDELLACIAWVAPGFELVHSLYPGWRFAAADTVAAFGLHASLHVGPRVALPEDPAGRAAWRAALEQFSIQLRCNGEVMDEGQAVNVLDGPLHALRHLVDLLGDGADPDQPPLLAGEVVTTGTLTRALPVYPGQRWTMALDGVALARFSLWLR